MLSRHPSLNFVPFFVFAALGFVLLHGAAAGVVSLVAVLALVGGCIAVLRRADRGAVRQSERTNLTGWFL